MLFIYWLGLKVSSIVKTQSRNPHTNAAHVSLSLSSPPISRQDIIGDSDNGYSFLQYKHPPVEMNNKKCRSAGVKNQHWAYVNKILITNSIQHTCGREFFHIDCLLLSQDRQDSIQDILQTLRHFLYSIPSTSCFYLLYSFCSVRWKGWRCQYVLLLFFVRRWLSFSLCDASAAF